VLDGNRDQGEVILGVPPVKLLPTWQLLAAASPGAPPEEQSAFPAQIGKGELAASQQRQGQLRNRLANLNGV